MNKKFILLDGTSCAGKSTICNFFNKKKFSCFQIDYYDYCNNKRVKNKWLNTLKNLKNEYYNSIDFYTMIGKMIFEDSLKIKSNVLFDDVEQFSYIKMFKEKKLINNLYIINVFSNFETLTRNIELRRKNKNNPPEIVPFSQFSNRYIKTDEDNPKKIEKINRNNFKNLLLKNFKYEFQNKKQLIDFSNEIFKKMEIDDNDDHYIKVRDNIRYDYLLNTTNKSKSQIFKELQDKVFDNNTFFLNNKNSKTRKKLSK
jgi:adenylate kinase family enzyme